MGGTEALLLREMDFSSSGSPQERGKIDMECYARSRLHIQEFMRRLDDAGYYVAQGEIRVASDPDYPNQVTLTLILPVVDNET